jgi:hypothetical protein
LPTYHVGVASIAAATDDKWVDNLLSRFDIPGVEHARQGTPRRLSLLAIQHIALSRRLVDQLDLPLPGAVRMAARILAQTGDLINLSPELRLQFDRASFVAEIDRLVEHAVESHVPARRGRPPHRRA